VLDELSGGEGEPAAEVAHAGQAVDDGHPRAADRGNVHAVADVAADVGQVHQHRVT